MAISKLFGPKIIVYNRTGWDLAVESASVRNNGGADNGLLFLSEGQTVPSQLTATLLGHLSTPLMDGDEITVEIKLVLTELLKTPGFITDYVLLTGHFVGGNSEAAAGNGRKWSKVQVSSAFERPKNSTDPLPESAFEAVALSNDTNSYCIWASSSHGLVEFGGGEGVGFTLGDQFRHFPPGHRLADYWDYIWQKNSNNPETPEKGFSQIAFFKRKGTSEWIEVHGAKAQPFATYEQTKTVEDNDGVYVELFDKSRNLRLALNQSHALLLDPRLPLPRMLYEGRFRDLNQDDSMIWSSSEG